MGGQPPHFHGHRQRLRGRFVKSGLAGFADYEIVELLLTLAIPRSDVKEPAKALLARFGNLRGILDAPLAELQAVSGIGTVTPVALRIIREVASLYLQQSAESHDALADPHVLARFWRVRIGALSNEVFQAGYLDAGYRLLRDGIETLEEGTIDRAAVYPRRVIEAAIRRADQPIAFNTSGAVQYTSRTRFNEVQNTVFLGADALPGDGVDANARLSTLACLAHELAHAERFQMGYRRPTDLPDVLLDEAATSLRASFTSILSPKDREDLVEDARDRLIQWLARCQQEGETDAQS